MTQYVIRRLLLAIPTVLGVVTLVFIMLRIMPGDAAYLILTEGGTAEQIQRIRHELGIDRPIYVQYFDYLRNLVRLDFGRSYLTRQRVLVEIQRQLPWTIQLAGAALLVSVGVSIPFGILAALKRNTIVDHGLRVIALLGLAMPDFWLGLMALWLFGFVLGWFPISGVGEPGNVPDILYHLILPATILGLALSGLTTRMTRSCMLEVISQDYIRTARAKGLMERVVVYRHALKNALIPVVTIVGLDVGRLLGGAVVAETVFARPGLGKLLVQSILDQDNPQAQAGVLIFALVFVLVNLLTDLTYGFLDPRIKYQ